MAQGRPTWWNDDIVSDVERTLEDDGVSTSEVVRSRLEGWDPDALEWIRVLVDSTGALLTAGGGGGGGGAVTVADGADVALGSRADAAWSGSGNATVIAALKKLKSLLDDLVFYQQEELVYIEAQTDYQTRLDDVGGGVTYLGKAIPGNFTSAASWQIKKITESAGDITIQFADGDNFYDNVWDDRASLTYS